MSKAREYLKRAVQLGKVAESYTALGELYIQEDEMQNAIDVFNTAVEYVMNQVTLTAHWLFCCITLSNTFKVSVGGGGNIFPSFTF